jgi:hypothetical protein
MESRATANMVKSQARPRTVAATIEMTTPLLAATTIVMAAILHVAARAHNRGRRRRARDLASVPAKSCSQPVKS